MKKISAFYHSVDEMITRWMARYGILILRMSLGLIFLWFGVLKFFPGVSPAQELATHTIETISFGLILPKTSILLLAIWETLIGLGLIFGVAMRITLALLFLQMAGTITPIFLFPNEVFTQAPFIPTLEGQYIVKNLVLISAGIVIGATVRGGDMIADPDVVRRSREQVHMEA